MHFLCRQIRNQRYPQNDRPLIMKILTHQNRRSPLGRFLRMGTVPQRGQKVEDHLQNHPLVRHSMGLRNQILGKIELSCIIIKEVFPLTMINRAQLKNQVSQKQSTISLHQPHYQQPRTTSL